MVANNCLIPTATNKDQTATIKDSRKGGLTTLNFILEVLFLSIFISVYTVNNNG